MNDLWQEHGTAQAPSGGGRDSTPDMEDLWDIDPQRQFIMIIYELFYNISMVW